MPEFEVVDQDGNVVSSKDFIGKKTIVYFYPKDNTPGCTAEACNLRDNYEALKAQGYNVVGVSKDSAASHRKFIDKFDLPFTLLSDKSTQMLQDFGAWALSDAPSSSTRKECWRGLSRRWTQRTTLPKFSDDSKNHAAQILG